MERWPDIRRRAYEYKGQEKEFTVAIENTSGALRSFLEKYIGDNQITLLHFNHIE